jgi:hypothetical protein
MTLRICNITYLFFIIIIIIFHHEFRPRWPVSVSAFTSSSSLFSGLPGRLFLDDILEVLYGACSLLLDERFEPVVSVCTKFFLLKFQRGFLLKYLPFFCGQEECTLLFVVNI